MSDLRALICADDFPPHIFGGTGTFCYNLAHGLAATGTRVTVIAGCPSRMVARENASVVKGNPEVIWVPRIESIPNHQLFYQVMSMNMIRELSTKFDIVHGQDSSSYPLIAYCKRKKPARPWVVTVHTGHISELYGNLHAAARYETSLKEFVAHVVGFPIFVAFQKGIACHADALAAVSHEVSREVEDYEASRDKLLVIPNGVDMVQLAKTAANGHSIYKTSRIRLFHASRHYWRKGILPLLESIACLVHKFGFKDFELQIFGKGPLDFKIRECVSRLNLNDNVKLNGFVRYEDQIASIANSDIVCFPSVYEGCPIGMLEAMALGKPVVAFRRPYSEEIMASATTSTLAQSVEDYAKCLHSLCVSEELREKIGSRLRDRALQEFDLSLMVKRYTSLYEDLLANDCN